MAKRGKKGSGKSKRQSLSDFKRRCRSKFEARIGKQLINAGVPLDYENVKIKYTQPAKKRTYTPDFILPNGIIVEAKGRLTRQMRQKHEWINKQYPELDIRFVFQRASNKIYKGSKTSYADWADRLGIPWAEGRIPEEWFKEPKKEINYDDKQIIRRANP